MRHQEGTFRGVGEVNLYYQVWHPDQQVKANLLFLHGLGGHSGHYERVATALVKQNFSVYSFDLRGHGRSPGQRGHINSWAEYRGDLRRFFHLMQSQDPEIPYFLGGQSLGGLIALDYAFRCPAGLQGLIISGVPLGKVRVAPIKMAIGKALSRVYPRFSLSTGLNNTTRNIDPSVMSFYLNDPLCHDRGTARLATEYLKTVQWLQTQANVLHLPILLLHGLADQIAPPEDVRVLFERITAPNKQKREYEGGYHSVYDEVNSPKVLADLTYWLEEQLRSPHASSSLLLSAPDSSKDAQNTVEVAMRSLFCQISLDGLEIA